MDEEKVSTADVINIMPLKEKSGEIVQQLLTTDDYNEAQSLVQDFNLNQMKKSTYSAYKWDELKQKTQDQMIKRMEEHADEFSNEDLIAFVQVADKLGTNDEKKANLIKDIAPIQINQQINQVNINTDVEQLNRESRKRIMDFVNAQMQQTQNQQTEIKIVEEQPTLLNEEENGNA